jgi:hypothetical protein
LTPRNVGHRGQFLKNRRELVVTSGAIKRSPRSRLEIGTKLEESEKNFARDSPNLKYSKKQKPNK